MLSDYPVRELHVFYVRSDFQYVVCKGIIKKYNIKNENCYFVADRQTPIENCYEQSLIYGIGRYLNFKERLKLYLKKRSFVNEFFRDKKVTVYMPFSLQFASHTYNEFIYYEEGLSAYAINEQVSDTSKMTLALMKCLVYFLAPTNKQVRGYLMGFVCKNKRPANLTRLLSFSKDCYNGILDDNVKKEVISVPSEPIEEYTIPRGSTMLVLDRLSEFGRPFELENYRRCIDKILEQIKSEGVNQLFVKYHPADYNNKESVAWMNAVIKSKGFEYQLFNGRLEYLALQNIKTRFVGTNSTILYYAPVLGSSNQSLSFCKLLSVMDEKYRRFLRRWGDFVAFFSKNVECIDV